MPSKGYTRAELDADCEERTAQEQARSRRHPGTMDSYQITTCAITNKLNKLAAETGVALRRSANVPRYSGR